MSARKLIRSQVLLGVLGIHPPEEPVDPIILFSGNHYSLVECQINILMKWVAYEEVCAFGLRSALTLHSRLAA